MDFIRMSLVLSLCVTLMSQAVFSAPAFTGSDVETVDFLPELNADTASIRARRDVDANDDDEEESNDFLTRIRRQVAQMASGRPGGYGGARRYRSRGRLHGRRRYNTRRVSRTRGRVVDW